MPSTITDRLYGLTTSVAIKAPCRVATTAAITLSGVQTIDGVSVVAGDRVLVKDQADATDNGIWIVGAATWGRAADFDGSYDAVQGTLIYVLAGSGYASTYWEVTTSGAIVIGADDVEFEMRAFGALNRVSEFTATAAQAVFVLDFTPLTQSAVYANGVRLATSDYSASGTTVTLVEPRSVGDSIIIVSSEAANQSTLRIDMASTASSKGAGLVGFSDASTYATGSVGNHLKRFVVVTDAPYLATGNGATDDTSAIQAAITAVQASGGGDLIFPKGAYKYTTLTIAVGDTVNLIGQGWESSLSTSSATADAITVNPLYTKITGLRFTSSAVRTAGVFVHLVGANSVIEQCFIDGDFIGVKLSGVATKCRFNTFSNGVASAKRIWATGGDTSQSIIGNLMHAQASPTIAAGVYVDDSSALKILSNDIIQQGRCIHIAPGTGQVVTSLYATDNFLDTALGGAVIEPTGTGAVTRCKFVDNWASSHSTAGLTCDSTAGTIDGVDWIGGENHLNVNGVALIGAGTINVRVKRGSARGNSASAVSVGTGVTKFYIDGLECQAADGLAVNGYGVFLTGTNDNYEIKNCDFTGQTTATISGHGGYSSTKRVFRNRGYVTENSGSSSVADTTTSITINHGLSETPRAQDISFAQAVAPTVIGNVLCLNTATISSTQFTIFCGSAAAGAINFTWRAKIGDF